MAITEKNKKYYAEERRLLRRAMLNKKLVVFVGSGASLDSGMPSWKDSIAHIANKLNITNDNIDYLKIPQFYYNSRGKKEYVELMREIFRYGDNLEANDIHRNIIRLNTHTMITTNYDNLLEKAASENSEFIQVISQDKDLPYRTVEKELIKMHGDFSTGNFVLREDDYLHYSKTFRLIEAYVKALIATNVILFIGYSFSDPDVKQIFTWVKDILEDDFQRAYMLEVQSRYDIHEYEYYKNLGINIIYASEMHDVFNKEDAFIYTNEFLEYLLEEDISENEIDKLYKMLQPYSVLNYVSKNYISRAFRECGISVENNMLSSDSDNITANELLTTLFADCRDTNDERIGLINAVVSKSNIEKITTYHKQGERLCERNTEIPRTVEGKHEKLKAAVEEFDFETLKYIREENEARLSESFPELYLEQAYVSYVLFEYTKAYRYLRICSNLFYRKKQFVWYFISEVNRKNVGRIIVNGFWPDCSESEKKTIQGEIDALNIENIYEKLPTETENEKDFLQDLYTFRTYYTIFQDTYLKSKKTEEEANSDYIIFAADPSYRVLRQQIQNCYYYDFYNFIMADRYREELETYRLFAHSIIISACSVDLSTPGFVRNESFHTGNIHATCLEKFDIYIILRYMSPKELKSLLKDNCSNIVNIDEEARDYLQNIVANMATISPVLAPYFWTYLIFSGYLQLNEILVKETLLAIKGLLNDYNVCTHGNELLRFIGRAYEQKMINTSDHASTLFDIIEELIALVINSENKSYYSNLLAYSLSVYKEIKESYCSTQLLSLAKGDQYDILARIYPFCSKVVQTEIQRSTNCWSWCSNKPRVEIYERLVLANLYEPDEKIEQDILTSLENLKEESKNRFQNGYEQVISSLTSLYLNEKVVKKKDIKDAVKRSEIPVYEWLIEPEKYDYETFNVEWLNYCHNKLLKKIASQPSAKQGILKKSKDIYLSRSVSSDALQKVFQFFIELE